MPWIIKENVTIIKLCKNLGKVYICGVQKSRKGVKGLLVKI